MKRFLTILALGVLLAAPAAGQVPLYGWTISNSTTDPFSNFGAADVSGGPAQLYLWLQCTADPSNTGASAAEFDLSPSGFTAVFGFTPVSPYINGGPSATELQLILGCAFGATRVGAWIVNTGYTGDLCLVPSAANGFNVTVDCGPSFLKWTNTTIGFALNGSADPACADNLCQVSVESESWGAIKGLYR